MDAATLLVLPEEFESILHLDKLSALLKYGGLTVLPSIGVLVFNAVAVIFVAPGEHDSGVEIMLVVFTSTIGTLDTCSVLLSEYRFVSD